MKKMMIMMFVVALTFLVTTSLAVTNSNFEFVVPSDYETFQEKANVGIYKKEGSILMYAVKSIYDGSRLEVLQFSTEELTKLIKDMYGESAPNIEGKSTVSLKNRDAVRLDITNEQETKSVLFFTNSDSALIMIAFSGTVFDEEEMNAILQSFEVKGLMNKQYALIVVAVVVAFVIFLVLFSKVKKK
ncbi:MAG: hypothetical protein J6M02_03745 [Clostridia bacterium]|nr:hypothetical protein [Clostridia bacterium]